MPYIGRDLNRGNYLKLDDISSSFNGSTQTFNLTVGGSAFRPGSAFSILVSVGGVIQEPESAYQVNNSEITFANAPTAQDGFFCLALGVPIGIGVPGNGTVNGTQMAKPFNYDGFFYLDDANNRVGIGSLQPKQALDVIGNANISGILTASSFSGGIIGGGGINAGVVTCTGLDLNGNGDVSGNFVIGGDLTVSGTTSTIDTNLIGVDKIEVATALTNVAVAVTHTGSGDLVRLYDGTSQVVTIDDEGKVGLGTGNPNARLRIHHDSDDSAIVWLSGADVTSEYLSLGIQPGLAVLRGGGVGGTSCALSFETSTSGTEGEKMRLDANGILKLGSGLTAGHVTNVPSNIRFFLNNNRGSYGGQDTNAVIFDNQNAALDAGGTLTFAGFSGTNPIAKASIRGGNEGTTTSNAGYFSVFTRPASGSLSEKFRITSDGKVGIGSLTPPTGILLDVQGHAGSGAQHTIRSKSTAANASNFVRSESSDGLYIGLLKYGTSHADYGALEAGGGAVYANSSVPITIMSDGGSGYINFATGGNTERLRITSGGQLYLGPYKTSTPALNVPYEIRVAPYNWGQSEDIAAISMGNHSGSTGSDDGQIVFKTALNANTDANALKERLRIGSTGTITQQNFSGIGLHMIGAGDPTIRVQDNDGTNQYGEFAHNGGDTYIVTRNNTSHGEFLIYSQNGSETKIRLKIDANGHISTQDIGTYSFNNDTANAKIFEVTGDGTVGGYGGINISGNQNANNTNIGNLRFVNRENSEPNSGGSANAKAIAAIQVYTVTSDSNAGDDCGGYMQFLTKPEGGGNSSAMIINQSGQLLINGAGTESGTNTKLAVCATGSPGSNPSSITNNVIATFRATGAAGHAASIAVLAGNDGSSAVHFGDTDNDIIGRIIYNHTSSNATDYMAFYVIGAEKVRIDKDGRLRVASTDESADPAFDDLIVGDFSGNRGISILSANGQNSTLGFAKSGALSDGYIQYNHNSTANSSWMRIKSSGDIYLNDGTDDQFVMKDGGNIGINNTDPQEKLQIAGNISLGNRGDNTSRYIGKGTNGSGGVIGDASANENSSWIGFVSGTGTGYEDRISFATHKAGTSGGERLRIDGEGVVKVKEKLVILNGGGFSETAAQGLTVRNSNIYLEQGQYITWNNGDNDIGGVSGYHLRFRTYNGSSNTEKLQISGGSGNDGNVIKTTQPGAIFAYDVQSNNTSTCRPANGDWVYVGSIIYGPNQRSRFVVEWASLHAPASAHHGFVLLEAGGSYAPNYDYDWSESMKVLSFDAHNSGHFKAWKMVKHGTVLKVFGQWGGDTVSQGTFIVTGLTGDTHQGTCFRPAQPVVDNNSYDGTRLTIDGTFQQGGSGLNPSFKKIQGGSYYGILHAHGGLDTYGALTNRGTGAGTGYFGTIWCNYGGISGNSSKQPGSFTPYAGQVCPYNSGNRYIHIKFNIVGGSMWMVEIMGYEYIGSWTSSDGSSTSGDKVHHSISAGYHYSGQALYNGKSSAYRGIAPGWYLSGGYVCCYIDTNNTGTSNRWGFYKFAGGVDGIIGRSNQRPTNIIAYSYSSSTSDQF